MSTSMQGTRYRNNRSRPHHNVGNNRGASYPNSNNYGRRETPEQEAPQNSTPRTVLYGDHRSTMVMCSILGTRTTVKTRNGKSYVGTTSSISPKGDIALQDSKLLDDESGQNACDILILKDNFVVCKTNGVDFKGLTSSQEFTDSAIAGRLNGSSDPNMKELQPWQDDDDVATTNISLDDNTGGWDSNSMFKVNNEKFNVKTSFKADLSDYTVSLPTPDSEGYEERARIAQKVADEIERSEVYQQRIAMELTDGDEESKFSAVHRQSESHSGSHRTSLAMNDRKQNFSRTDGDSNPRNGNMSRNQGRGLQRQNSPYSTSAGGHHHLPSRPMNNHYHSGPPPSTSQAGGPVSGRSQGPPPSMHRGQPPQQQNHMGSPYQQPPPLSQQKGSHPPPSLGSRPPHPLASQMIPQKGPHQGPMQGPPRAQAPPPMAHGGPGLKQMPPPPSVPSVNGSAAPPQASAALRHVNGGPPPVEVKANPVEGPTKAVDPSKSPDTPNTDSGPQQASSPPTPQAADRRPPTRPMEPSSEDSRNKIGHELHDFQKKFVLNTSEASSPVEVSSPAAAPSGPAASGQPSAPVTAAEVVSTSANTRPETSALASEAAKQPALVAEKSDEPNLVKDSKLNPMAKEFKPSSKPPVSAAVVETQSPSPQQRVSPHYQLSYQNYHHHNYVPTAAMGIPAASLVRKKATVSVVPGANELTAHQVTGQPLMATQPMIFQPLPHAGYQGVQSVQLMQMPTNAPARMVGPNSVAMAQQAQQPNMEQNASQSQPQPVFMTPGHHPMPAHLTPHPQPLAPSQPPAVPNPAPSPVLQQQQQQQQQAQHPPLQHAMAGGPQGPPQSGTPQPFPLGLQTLPRTSGGHAAVSFPLTVSGAPQYSYPGSASAQYSFAAPQPQTSQNSGGHGGGHSSGPQYVVMPQPGPQPAHPPMQQPGQHYSTAGLQFQQHNLMQGPPQMPPSGPNQGGQHMLHSAHSVAAQAAAHAVGMQGLPSGLHQQSTPPAGMYIVPPHYHQQ